MYVTRRLLIQKHVHDIEYNMVVQTEKKIMLKEEIKELVAMALKDHKVIFDRLDKI